MSPLARTLPLRLALAASVATATLIAWLLARSGTAWQHSFLHAHANPASVTSWTLAVVMWQAMMVAMMLPVVTPWLGLVAVTHAPRAAGPVMVFTAGYFAAWLVYSLAAASGQLGLQHIGVLDDGWRLIGPLGGLVLVGAGLFQFSALKRACLRHCRSPIAYLLSRWRSEPPGAFRLGLQHGLYCVGCCWALMAVSFAVGLMNLAWMAGIALIAALEQLAPHGHRVARLAGVALMTWGTYLLVST